MLNNYLCDLLSHVAMQMYIEVDKQKIYLNHCPFLCYGGSYDGTWQLFGHVHTSKNNTGKDASRLNMLFPTQYDVGVDNNDFAPVSYEQVKGIINRLIELTNKKCGNENTIYERSASGVLGKQQVH